MNRNFEKGFAKAYSQLRICDEKEAREELKKILGVKETSLWLYRNGRLIPSADKAQRVIEFFQSKGINDAYI